MSPIKQGLLCGFLVALFQSGLSIVILRWAWKKSFFYWVWGGGILFRLCVFAFTAFVVHFHTNFNFVATMLTLVFATTIFLVAESVFFLPKTK
jgi:hypothetical protein